MSSRGDREPLIRALLELRQAALEEERKLEVELAGLHPNHQAGARNLMHYLSVRRHEVRTLQAELARLGLSSLGRLEHCCLATLNATTRALLALDGRPPAPELEDATPTDFDSGNRILSRHAEALLGKAPDRRRARIMVTVSPKLDPTGIPKLLEAGMTIARINATKGDAETFESLVEVVRRASRQCGRECKILFDLGGPNPRSQVFERLKRPKRVSVRSRFAIARGEQAAHRLIDRGLKSVIGCSLEQILDDLRPGEHVSYDDGKVSGVVSAVDADGAVISVRQVIGDRARLKADKTLNFPDSDLDLPSLTSKDLADLDFAAAHVDMIGTSFVRTPEDVDALIGELDRRGAEHLGLVLKIETAKAFDDFPRLLFTALRRERVGVMVARGDMAMELGYARLSEAQEDLLWLCEASLVPTIWATQVLESLNKTGIPTRGDVTDAAMSGRAEAVMLNHGDHLLETVEFLRDVLERMQEHQEKKRSLLRKLELSAIEAASPHRHSTWPVHARSH
jgi:pyruvate kinase